MTLEQLIERILSENPGMSLEEARRLAIQSQNQTLDNYSASLEEMRANGMGPGNPSYDSTQRAIENITEDLKNPEEKRLEVYTKDLEEMEANGITEGNINYDATVRAIESIKEEMKSPEQRQLENYQKSLEELVANGMGPGNPTYDSTVRAIESLTNEINKTAEPENEGKHAKSDEVKDITDEELENKLANSKHGRKNNEEVSNPESVEKESADKEIIVDEPQKETLISEDEKNAIKNLGIPITLTGLIGEPKKPEIDSQPEPTDVPNVEPADIPDTAQEVEEEHVADKTLWQRAKEIIKEHKAVAIAAAIAVGVVIAGAAIYSFATGDASATTQVADSAVVQEIMGRATDLLSQNNLDTIGQVPTDALSQNMGTDTTTVQDLMTQVADTVGQNNPNNLAEASEVMGTVAGQVVDPTAAQAFDYSTIGEGTDVATNLQDALTGENTLQSNEYMAGLDHLEAVNQAKDVINLDGKTPDELQAIFDQDDYGIRGSKDGVDMGWFSEDTIMDKARGGR